MAAADIDALTKQSIALVGWSPSEAEGAALTPLAGGITGATFALKTAAGTPKFVIRKISDEPWVPGFSLVGTSKQVADAGVGAAVVASSDTLIAYEYVPSRMITIDDVIISDGELPGVVRDPTARAAQADARSAPDTIRALARAVAALHKRTASAVASPTAAMATAGSVSEIDKWRDIAFKALEAHGDGNATAVVEDFKRRVDAELVAGARFLAYSPGTECAAGLARDVRGLTHGDLHFGNILERDADPSRLCFVDLDRAIERPVVTDVAYLFMTWGDQYFHRGFTPAADGGSGAAPYVPEASRFAFCEAYLAAFFGAPVGEAHVREFLFNVECAAYGERLRFFLILVAMSGGNLAAPLASFAVQGFAALLPSARELLATVADGPADGEPLGPRREEIVRRGLFGALAASGPSP